ncbi:hypothetical protein BD626DRAFT_653 [Schizophyllum amplum]|uniref:Uncharacterized protein n=1 Tax=Schizophyllum amplum TaxID=97359 RepID=A0A550CVI6_9AGAR|nr:hypothetical protein BD626DRAFT_653 [Auriculariopsis ampla]
MGNGHRERGCGARMMPSTAAGRDFNSGGEHEEPRYIKKPRRTRVATTGFWGRGCQASLKDARRVSRRTPGEARGARQASRGAIHRRGLSGAALENTYDTPELEDVQDDEPGVQADEFDVQVGGFDVQVSEPDVQVDEFDVQVGERESQAMSGQDNNDEGNAAAERTTTATEERREEVEEGENARALAQSSHIPRPIYPTAPNKLSNLLETHTSAIHLAFPIAGYRTTHRKSGVEIDLRKGGRFGGAATRARVQEVGLLNIQRALVFPGSPMMARARPASAGDLAKSPREMGRTREARTAG